MRSRNNFAPSHSTHFDANGLSLSQLELQKIIDAQARELTLMSSSWYEIQSRLQSNGTISRFRHGSSLADAQKGWLARQRSVVAGR